jgi:hypothetical protein
VATTSIDELLAALQELKRLQETVRKHDEAIAVLTGRLAALSQRVERIVAP